MKITLLGKRPKGQTITMWQWKCEVCNKQGATKSTTPTKAIKLAKEHQCTTPPQTGE